MKSVIQKEKRCFICKGTYFLECHHIFRGTANRKKSEEYGLKVWLCRRHHTGPEGVHNKPALDRELKVMGQRKFEEKYSREKFIREFGRNYLE